MFPFELPQTTVLQKSGVSQKTMLDEPEFCQERMTALHYVIPIFHVKHNLATLRMGGLSVYTKIPILQQAHSQGASIRKQCCYQQLAG